MKSIAILIPIFLCCMTRLHAEEPFEPRFAIDHKTCIDEALKYLLKERPDIRANSLQFLLLSYHFQPAKGTTVESAPTGNVIKLAGPFDEGLQVLFQLMDSKRSVINDEGRKCTEYDNISVQFPTPRKKEWVLGKGVRYYYDDDK